MKKIVVAICAMFFFNIQIQAQVKQNIYQFKVEDLEGNQFDFSTLKGKKILVVNTASECGLTPQYEQLQEIYTTYKDKNFVIVGFPANNFGSQEPGTNKEIGAFCQKNYGVTFPMMAKSESTAAVSPSLIPMCNKVPELNDSNSIVALSVSISARISPSFIVSPTFFNQVATVPSVIVSLKRGIVIFVAIIIVYEE